MQSPGIIAPDDPSHYFTPAETWTIYVKILVNGDKCLHKELCVDVAFTFSHCGDRNGKPSVTWEHVHSWFKEKLKQPSKAKSKAVVDPPVRKWDLGPKTESKISPGSRVEKEDRALYYDAHVVNIKRGSHDDKRCNCLFLVHFDHDNTEEPLGVKKNCRRPEE